MAAIDWYCGACFGALVVYRLVVWVAVWTEPPVGASEAPDCGPVSWFRPLKGGVREIQGKLATFLQAVGRDDQVIFGVEAHSTELRVCQELASRDSRVAVVICAPAEDTNPKIGKLLQMQPKAQHECWAVVDAEALVTPEFVAHLRRELRQADAVTVGYRFVGMESLPQWLDALAVVQTLWPGLRLVRRFATLRFTLGACTAFRRRDLAAIGGWQPLSLKLAEDHELGQRLSRAGKTIQLSSAVLDLEVDPLHWQSYWRHQRRVAVTYRAATPSGAAGMILTRGFSLCLLAALITVSPSAWFWTAACAAVAALAALTEAHCLRYPIRPWLLLAPLAEVIETACWLLAWFERKVWWGGRWRVVSWRGELRRADDTP